MEAKQANFWASFSLHVCDWFGPYVAWDATSYEIKETLFGHRSFKFMNEERTKICHQNTLNMSDGKIVTAGPWELTCEDVLEDGLVYPLSGKSRLTTRVLLQEDGAFTFVTLVPNEVTKFSSEIGSCYTPDYRFTNGFVYNTSGKLSKVTLWREHSKREPEKPFWSTDNQMKDGWQVSIPDENFTGAERIVKSNLDVEIVPNCSWDRHYWSPGEGKENELLFLPENIALACPADISDRTEFQLSVCWISDGGEEREIRQHTLYYRDGRLSSFKQGIYRQEKA